MSDTRQRFEAWASSMPHEFDIEIQDGMGAWPGQYEDYITQCAWEGWQAAERETARRCAAICHESTESLAAEMDIKAEFPGAFE